MGLLEEIEDTKKKLAEIQEDEKPEDEGVSEENETEEENTDEQPEETDETPADEPEAEQEEEKEEPVLSPTAADFARMRREKKAKEREAEQLRKELEEARRSSPQNTQVREETKPDSDPEPDRQKNYELWLEWKDRQIEKKVKDVDERLAKLAERTEKVSALDNAVAEFQSYEADFKAIEPNYDKAAEFYTKELARSVKLLNPNASGAEIGAFIKQTVITKAASYAKQGLDPAEELYNEAIAAGFSPSSDEGEEEREIKPDMKRLANNRKRNAGMAGASGRTGAGKITREAASALSVGEWARLSASEKKRLLSGG